MIYNDAYSTVAGSRHPACLGQSIAEVWPESKAFIEDVIQKCFNGQPVTFKSNHSAEVLDVLNQHVGELPNVIFMDINMPQMDGWACLQALKETAKYKDIPVIVYSTSSNPKDVKHAFELGAQCFCVKPDSYREMQRMLKLIADNLQGNFLDAVAEYKDKRPFHFFLPEQ
jgi:CheY-like chemotaxis protein